MCPVILIHVVAKVKQAGESLIIVVELFILAYQSMVLVIASLILACQSVILVAVLSILACQNMVLVIATLILACQSVLLVAVLSILACQSMVLVLFVCFCCFTSHVNSYGHCGTVSSLDHTFSWAGLRKRLTSNLCTYFRL